MAEAQATPKIPTLIYMLLPCILPPHPLCHLPGIHDRRHTKERMPVCAEQAKYT